MAKIITFNSRESMNFDMKSRTFMAALAFSSHRVGGGIALLVVGAHRLLACEVVAASVSSYMS